ncbi:hypothetical protein AWENTII_002370 [Aspergillus wentii]
MSPGTLMLSVQKALKYLKKAMLSIASAEPIPPCFDLDGTDPHPPNATSPSQTRIEEITGCVIARLGDDTPPVSRMVGRESCNER